MRSTLGQHFEEQRRRVVGAAGPLCFFEQGAALRGEGALGLPNDVRDRVRGDLAPEAVGAEEVEVSWLDAVVLDLDLELFAAWPAPASRIACMNP